MGEKEYFENSDRLAQFDDNSDVSSAFVIALQVWSVADMC
jgi:hypothetical protein